MILSPINGFAVGSNHLTVSSSWPNSKEIRISLGDDRESAPLSSDINLSSAK